MLVPTLHTGACSLLLRQLFLLFLLQPLIWRHARAAFLCKAGRLKHLDPYGHTQHRCVVTWFALLPGLLKLIDLRLDFAGDAHLSVVDKPSFRYSASRHSKRYTPQSGQPQQPKHKQQQAAEITNDSNVMHLKQAQSDLYSHVAEILEQKSSNQSQPAAQQDKQQQQQSAAGRITQYKLIQHQIPVPVAEYRPLHIHTQWTPLPVPIHTPVFTYGLQDLRHAYPAQYNVVGPHSPTFHRRWRLFGR